MSLTLARLGIVAGSFPIAAGGDFESIATVTVGSGGASSIEFTSIPGTYQHLQIRVIVRGAGSGNPGLLINFNTDTGSNYARHLLLGDGSSATASGNSSETFVSVSSMTTTSHSASIFAASIIDILDYSSTSKNSTIRAFAGRDMNGSGNVNIHSGLWLSTSAVTSVTLSSNQNFAQHTTAALYGVKAP